MYGEIEGTMDSGLEERILPSIRRSQMLLIYRNGGVVGQVAHFNLTPEAFLCRGFNFLPFVLSGSTEEPDLHTTIVSVR